MDTGNGHGDGGAPPSKTCLERFSHAIESRMTGFFSRLGEIVATHPYKTLAIAFIAVIIGGSGISILEEESRGDKLWLPSDTRAQNDWVRNWLLLLTWPCWYDRVCLDGYFSLVFLPARVVDLISMPHGPRFRGHWYQSLSGEWIR